MDVQNNQGTMGFIASAGVGAGAGYLGSKFLNTNAIKQAEAFVNNPELIRASVSEAVGGNVGRVADFKNSITNALAGNTASSMIDFKKSITKSLAEKTSKLSTLEMDEYIKEGVKQNKDYLKKVKGGWLAAGVAACSAIYLALKASAPKKDAQNI